LISPNPNTSHRKSASIYLLIIKKLRKMAKKNQHVLPHANGWSVKGAGNSKATAITTTQNKAIDIAREIAKNQGSELIIHGKNGQIRQKDSEGHDPKSTKG
jgi:hypothetical protein